MSKRSKKKLLSFIIVFILAAAGYLGGEVKNPDIVQPRSNISQNTNTESIEETRCQADKETVRTDADDRSGREYCGAGCPGSGTGRSGDDRGEYGASDRVMRQLIRQE